ncbi:hypothetical protein MIZ03_3145 [Rhodoferax lithotrophicus]|uniref:TIGR03790 family protein n=2 Tax=Rhodoferax lithotrophicus TaxID=2798804 RepID=A0ABM7MPK4_9BURK|nr:hypothetical protein MIZ03_3145 [Rhodoferax sp. MIZ03]
MRFFFSVMCLWAALLAHAQTTPSPATTPPEASQPATRHWINVPRIQGKLMAADMGLVINTADPYSVAVGAYYQQKRHIPPEQVLRLELPVRNSLSEAEFEQLDTRIRAHMGPQVQALALAWTQPFAVECNGITAAVTLGFEPCAPTQNTCDLHKASRYFNAAPAKPFTELGLRPSMLLASRSIHSAKAMIDRGVASDGLLGKLGGPTASAVFVSTTDTHRNVRAALFPPAGMVRGKALQVLLREGADTSPLSGVVLFQTGVVSLGEINRQQWLPGALADHLTSFGGQLMDGHGQMSVLDWLESGATASYGTVSEPCNHLQKFPHPQVLLLNYLQGATALEAYWRSVAWPAQGVFVGEPLAAPF